MYILKKKSSKKFTPIRGKRQKVLKIRKFLLFSACIILFAGCIWGLKEAAGILFNTTRRPAWLEWHLKRVNITGESGPLVEEVAKYISFEEGDVMTHSDSATVERLLSTNIKELKKVSVWRNLFNGNLNIKIKKHKPFALIKTESKDYLMEEGGLIFPDDKAPENGDLFKITAEGQIKDDLLPKELVELVKALKTADDIGLEETLLDLGDNTFSLKLREGTARMGGFKKGPEKIIYLAGVLKESSKRGFTKPFEINFDYFNDGKIYLKPTNEREN